MGTDFDVATDQYLADAGPKPPVQQDAAPSSTPQQTAAPPTPPGTTPTDFDTAIDQYASAQEVRLRSSLLAASQKSPDQHAKILDLSNRTGLSPGLVDGNEAKVEDIARAKALQGINVPELQRDHPDLLNWLSQPNNAGIAKNDVPVLTTLSHITQQLANPDGDALGVLPEGFLFSHGKIIEPQGANAQQYDTIQDLQDRLREKGNNELANEVNLQANRGVYDTLAKAGLGDIGAGFLSEGERFLKLVHQGPYPTGTTADYTGILSAQESPGVWGDVKRAIGGQVATLPLMLAGGPVGKLAEGILRARRAESLFTPFVGARIAKYLSTEALPVAATMAPMAAVSGAETAQEHGIVPGAMDALLNTVIPGAFGKVGVAKHLLGDAGESIPAGALEKIRTPQIDAIDKQIVLERGWGPTGAGETAKPFGITEYAQTEQGAKVLALEKQRQQLAEAEYRRLNPSPEESIAKVPAGYRGALRELVTSAVPQAGIGAVQALAGSLSDYLTGVDPEALKPDNVARRLAVGAATGGITGAAFALPDAMSRPFLAQRQKAVQAVHDGDLLQMGIDTYKQSQAAQTGDGGAKAVQGLIDQLAARGRTAVWMQADDFARHAESLGTTPQEYAAKLGLTDEYKQAQGLATKMKVPMGAFMQLGSEAGEGANITGKVSLAPDAPTPEEAAKSIQEDPTKLADLQERAKILAQTELAANTAPVSEGGSIAETVKQQFLAAGEPEARASYLGGIHQTFFSKLAALFNRVRGDAGASPMTAEDVRAGFQTRVAAKLPSVLEEQISNGNINGLLDRLRTSGPTGPVETEANSALKRLGIDLAKHSNKDVLAEFGKRMGILGEQTRSEQGDAHGLGTSSGRKPHGGYDPVQDKARADAVEAKMGRPAIQAHLAESLAELPKVPLVKAKNVPYGMGMDVAETKRYIDPQFPLKMKMREGGEIETVIPTSLHEITETRLMKKGMSYDDAHDVANAVEREYLRSKGYSEKEIDEYEHDLKPGLRKVRDWTGEPPADLNPEPYRSEGEMNLLRAPGTGKRIVLQQGERINAPASGRLDVFAIMREWAKANGGKRPDAADPAWHKMIMEAAKKDAERGISLGQGEGGAPQGTYHIDDDLTHVITLWSGKNASTALHETMHYFTEVMGKLVDRADAPQELKDDYQKLMTWSGFGDRAGMIKARDEMMAIHEAIGDGEATDGQKARLRELAEPHERLARAFERYVMEGIAPTIGLRRAFARFKGWLMNIYKQVSSLKVDDLNDDVRGVLDRMLASETEIQAARERVSDTPAWTDRAKSGMSVEQWDEYQNLLRSAHQAARDELNGKLNDLALKAESDAAKADRADMRSRIADQVGQEPAYRAMSALQHGETPDGRETPRIKLKRSEVEKLLGKDQLAALPGKHDEASKNRGPSIFSNEDTTDVETAAKTLGYQSGAEMLTDLARAEDRDQKIDGLTDTAMKSKYPVPSEDPALMSRLADTALHLPNIRARLLEIETRQAAQLAGVERPDFRLERKQMTIAAKAIVREQTVSSLKPERFTAGEKKAAERYAEAMHDGRYDDAWQAKRQQLMNAELAKAAFKAQDRAEADRAHLKQIATNAATRKAIGKAGGYEWTVTYPDGRPQKSFSSPKDGGTSAEKDARTEAMNAGGTFERTAPYLDQIDKILDLYNLTTLGSKNLQTLKNIQDFLYGEMFDSNGHPTGFAADIPDSVLDQYKAGKRNWKTLTVDEFRDVRNAVDNLAKMARLKNSVDAEGKAIELQAKANEIATGLEANSIKRWMGDHGFIGKLAHYLAELVGPARLAEQADGHKLGPMQRTFVHPAGEAYASEIQLSERLNAPKRAANAEWGKRNSLELTRQKPLPKGIQWGRMGSDNELINPRSTMSLGEKLKLLATYGHKEGRQRVQDMHGLSHEDVIKILSSLDAKDIAYSNKMVDNRESLWSEIKAQDEKYNGFAREKVEALPVKLPNGIYKGGYDHLYYDGMPEQSPEEITQGILSGSATRGMTVAGGKERVANLKGKAVSLNLADWDRAQYEVVHQLSHRDFLVNNFKLLTNATVKDAMERALGRHGYDVFLRQAQGMAVGNRRSVGFLAKFVNTITSNANFAAWGFNPVFAAAHASQSVQVASEVGGLHAIASAIEYGLNVRGVTRRMYDLMPELEAQSKAQEHITDNIPLYTDAKDKMQQAGMWMVHKLFWQSQSVIAANAAFKKHMALTSNPKESAAYAMQVVNRIAGSNADKDIPELKRNPAFKALLNRMTFDIANYNNVAGSFHQVRYGIEKGDAGQALKGVVRILASTMGQGIVWNFIYDTMKHKSLDDQLKSWETPGGAAENLLTAGAASFVHTVPLLRDLMAPLFDGHQPASVTGMGWMHNIQGAVNYAANAKHKTVDKDVHAALGATGPLLGVPATQLGNIWDGWRYNQTHEADALNKLWNLAVGPPKAKK